MLHGRNWQLLLRRLPAAHGSAFFPLSTVLRRGGGGGFAEPWLHTACVQQPLSLGAAQCAAGELLGLKGESKKADLIHQQNSTSFKKCVANVLGGGVWMQTLLLGAL